MKHMNKLLPLALIASLGTAAVPAQAEGISTDTELQDIILTTFVIEVARQRCPDVSIRMARAQKEFARLATHTAKMGYTQDEVTAELASPEAQERHTAKAEDYIRSKGADPADKAAVCSFAQEEISARTDVGKLLKR